MSAGRLRRAAWWSMVGILVVGVVCQCVLGSSLENPEVIVPIAMYALVGAVIASHRPENPIGWVFLGVGAGAGLSALGDVARDGGDRHLRPDPVVGGGWGLGEWLDLVSDAVPHDLLHGAALPQGPAL